MEAASTPWQRPPDYYAEMIKSDEHMAKVKQQLMHEQEQMEAVEQRCSDAPHLIGTVLPPCCSI